LIEEDFIEIVDHPILQPVRLVRKLYYNSFMQAGRLYLNGQWKSSSQTIPVINPATGETLAAISSVTRAEIQQAIADAHASFESWRNLPSTRRADYLLATATEMNRRAEDIARTITLENGKPIAQSRTEVAVAVDHFRWFAEECRRAYGRIIPNQVVGKRHLVIKAPIGVVGAISPWNFPLFLAARKVAPALAAGCPTILKPSELTPLCAIQMAECIDAAGIPPGVFQLVTGDAPMIGEEFCSNPLVRKITFTGSTAVGQKLIVAAAALVKPLSLELGGHAPAIVFDDANLDQAIEQVLAAKFRNTGQSCIALNRLYVQKGIYGRFISRIVPRVAQMQVGNGLDESVEIGPLIDQRALDKAMLHIDDAIKRGAKLLCGGKTRQGAGFLLEPTLLENVAPDALCMKEETFGPIMPIVRFDHETDAISMANASSYGLSAYAFTTTIDRMWRIAESLQAGTIGINDGVPSTSIAPFGGVKKSGWGRELGSEGLEEFLETRHISIAIG
jgi:succinate-semialdehyde dehydrogenase/glutarate-semialdehyde dehydrogenase